MQLNNMPNNRTHTKTKTRIYVLSQSFNFMCSVTSVFVCASVTRFVESGKSLEALNSQLELFLGIVTQFLHARIRAVVAEVSELFEVLLTTRNKTVA